ncbi:FGGY-family carbohydrate kinase [Methylophaga pinxianii]|uniref:FGGY-family carbohydrate kinase n=1 Tax=Methylophaga pinxianii TaxID=2881052 RepID=UPI001CF292E4|nr:FGGY-family carbohydrate kinase [Methylophaga pinxianii]MCB2427863.1 FGGY-family carbohydrate kinase [Methylophaga pinxianii]UPH44653.1 FGGY-family carbohydrate kinase [Methylophaga pinxianii]
MRNSAWIGIDFGTSGCRVCAINDSGHVIAQTEQVIPRSSQSYPSPSEQAQILFDALSDLLNQLPEFLIDAICIDATSGSVMLCDSQAKPLSEMLMYNDARATQESETITSIAPSDSATLSASSGLAKLLYFQSTRVLPAKYHLLHQADWLAIQLGARPGVTDYNNALKSGFDVINHRWPDWLSCLTALAVLPEVVAPGAIIGKLSKTAMQKLRLTQDTPPKIKAGTTDSLAAFIATGANKIGDGVTSLGSTLVLKLLCQHPVYDAQRGIYSHKLGKHWLCGGASNTGGTVLRHFFTDEQLITLSQKIDLNAVPPDFYPLLKPGERFPIADVNHPPRLTPRPAEDQLFLHGILMGIARIEKAGYDCLEIRSKTKLQSIRTVGGGSRNTVWSQIRQSLLQVPFEATNHTDAAYGSALLAKDGLTLFQ